MVNQIYKSFPEFLGTFLKASKPSKSLVNVRQKPTGKGRRPRKFKKFKKTSTAKGKRQGRNNAVAIRSK